MSVFPLPLNAIEQYMLADDSADYPRSFTLVVKLHGTLERAKIEWAVNEATARHPLLRALVEYVGDRPRRWIECREPTYSIRWHEAVAKDACSSAYAIKPIDLRREPGVRFHVWSDDAGDVIGIEFHHATTDGMGAIQFVQDLLAIYENSAASLAPLDQSRLGVRDSFGLTGWRRPLRWLYGTFGWLGAIEFLSHRPTMLGRLWDRSSSDSRQSGFCARAFSFEETTALVQAAKQAGVTLNDRLLRDVFVAMQEFIEHHSPDRARDHQRIMVPVNLRSAGDELLPAANVVAMINIDRRPQRWTDTSRMLQVLHRELGLVKRFRLGIVFVQILGTLHTLFGSLKRFLRADQCQATCVVSNLGVVLPDSPSEFVRGVEFYPPIRPLTSAAFGAATHGGRLTLSLHYDAAAMSTDEGKELLNRVVGQLRAGMDAAVSNPELAAVG